MSNEIAIITAEYIVSTKSAEVKQLALGRAMMCSRNISMIISRDRGHSRWSDPMREIICT